MTAAATASHIDTANYLKIGSCSTDHLICLILTMKQSRSNVLAQTNSISFFSPHLFNHKTDI